VKAVAIQLSPVTKWPRPKHQPSASAGRSVAARLTSHIRPAKPSSVSGHRPSGAKPQAAIRPKRKAAVRRGMSVDAG
jgi:hypothetical protein